MARIIGILLFLAGVWYGVSAYNGDFAESPPHASPAEEPERAFGEPPPATGKVAPSAVTSRVRDRVNSAVAEGYSRHTGE